MSRDLYLNGNALTSLPADVFDALTALTYVGKGESARVGACEVACCRHTCARTAADMRHGHVHVWVDVRGRRWVRARVGAHVLTG